MRQQVQLLMFIGHGLARQRIVATFPSAAALAVVGFAVMLGEELCIGHRLGLLLDELDFSFGALACRAGIFPFARALQASAGVGRLAWLGSGALGVCVTHVLFVWALAAAFPSHSLTALLWQAPAPLLLTLALRQLPCLRRVLA